ncbi:MAG: sprT, partial [Acidimicrobiia bacterium]|nr:sprT [Acidimicrobiia bacterium]
MTRHHPGRRALPRRQIAALLAAVLAVAGSADRPGLASAAPGDVTAQVVGGAPVPAGKYPYVVYVSVRFSDTSFAACTGTLIDPSWVMTAAHCVTNETNTAFLTPPNVRIVWGSTDLNAQGTVAMVDQVAVHPGWDLLTRFASAPFDVALVHLTTPVAAAPARLLSRQGAAALPDPQRATVVGFGLSDPAGADPK